MPRGSTPANLLSRVPVVFEPNQGQFDPEVRFASRTAGYNLFITGQETVFVLRSGRAASHSRSSHEEGREQERASTIEVVRMSLKGAREPREVQGVEPTGGVSNYYLGGDPDRWRKGVPHFRRVEVQDVYPGIDLTYRGTGGRLEFDFLVAPGADAEPIRLAFEGASSIEQVAQGELIIETGEGALRLRRPGVFQTIGGEQVEVEAQFHLEDDSTVSFSLGAYREDYPLLIDPVVEYATFLGGLADDIVGGVAVDAEGNAYVATTTDSFDFPARNGFDLQYDLFTDVNVTKLTADGTDIFYSTFLGGDDIEAAHHIDVDAQGNAYVVGEHEKLGAPLEFPITDGAFDATFNGGVDGFITKIDGTGGALVYSTFLGSPAAESVKVVRVDDEGSVYVVGESDGSFPTTVGAYDHVFNGGGADGFLAKLNPAGSELLYATYFGGSGRERVRSMVLDDTGCAYIAGITESQDLPTSPGAFQPERAGGSDVFVIKLDASGDPPVYTTYLGGNQDEDDANIAIDSGGNAYVTGSTRGFGFPTTRGALSTVVAGARDAFVAKFSAAGQTLLYSTFLGGSNDDVGAAIAVDREGSIYVIGSTRSADFPVTADADDPTYAGAFDIFVSKLSSSGDRLLYSSYFGGGDSLRIASNGLVLTSEEKAVVAGVFEFLGRNDFPVTPGAFRRFRPRGPFDVFAAKFDLTEFGGVPQIAAGGILGAGLSVPPVSSISPNGIITIYGNAFAEEGFFVQVGPADLVDGRVPTRLGGVCVEIDGERSRMFTVTRRQLNVQAPTRARFGEVEVQALLHCDTAMEERSNVAFVELAPAAPEFFYFDLRADGVNPVAAINVATGEFIGPDGLFEKGLAVVAAGAGDTVAIFGTGFGLTAPLFEAGELPDGPAGVTLPTRVTVGGVEVTPARLLYVGVSGGNAGLYQVNLTISDLMPEGDQPVRLHIGDSVSPAGGFLRIEH